jgi:DNA-binding transcriptional LysR family regulator
LRRLGLVPKDLLELSSLPTLVDLVRQNVGVAIVPRLMKSDWEHDPALCVLPLPGRPVTRQIVMLEQARREHVTSLVRQQFMALLAQKPK